MKMDIEGSEVEVLPDLIFQGSLQYLDGLMVEYHGRLAKTEDRKTTTESLKLVFDNLSQVSKFVKEGHIIKHFELDDESFYKSNKPLPTC
jgi:hypothetical protein